MHLVLGLVRVEFKLEILQELWQHFFKDELLIVQLVKTHAASCT